MNFEKKISTFENSLDRLCGLTDSCKILRAKSQWFWTSIHEDSTGQKVQIFSFLHIRNGFTNSTISFLAYTYTEHVVSYCSLHDAKPMIYKDQMREWQGAVWGFCSGGSFSQKLSQLTPLSGLTPATLPCSVESAASQLAVSTGYRGLRVHDSRLRPNQALVSCTLARSAKLSRLSSKSLKLPPNCGPQAEDSATKLKRSHLNVSTVHVYCVCVLCTLFPPAAEICARLAGNYCQQLTTVKSGANDLVWQSVCYFTANQQGGGGGARGGVGQNPLHIGERGSLGVAFPPLVLSIRKIVSSCSVGGNKMLATLSARQICTQFLLGLCNCMSRGGNTTPLPALATWSRQRKAV